MSTSAALYAAIDGTWPAAGFASVGPWTLRDGRGGGKRVSAATGDSTDTGVAADAMRARGQRPLFMVQAGQAALDQVLKADGYAMLDPTNCYAAPVDMLTDLPIPTVTTFAIWEPLAIMAEIWAKGGIGPARIDVMHRAQGPKTGILARWREKPAGTAFAAIHDGIAMVHAVEVLEHQRRQGVAGWIMRKAAFWARDNGAHTLAVLTTKANGPANALYQRLGFTLVCDYHYREAPEDT
ncbi:MAG: GNAT family N-acetyltransferase [Pseudomonadota bacterium]